MRGGAFKYPQVSLIKDSGEVKYLDFRNYVEIKYSATGDHSVYYDSRFKKTEINGVELTPEQGEMQQPAGDYTVKYHLKDGETQLYIPKPYNNISSINLLFVNDVSAITNIDFDYYIYDTHMPILDLRMFNSNTWINARNYGGGIIFPESFGRTFTSLYGLFYECQVKNLDLSMFDTSTVVWFDDCFNYAMAESINVSNWDTSSATSFYYMFIDCSSLKSIDISCFDTSKIETMNAMFCRNSQLTTCLLPSNFGGEIMTSVFEDCSSLTDIDTTKIDFSRCTDMSWFFSNCSSLRNIDASKWDTRSVVKAQAVFSNTGISSIDLTSCNFSNTTNMKYLFSGCTSLVEVRMKGELNSGLNTTNMFQNVTTSGTLYYDSKYDYSKIIEALPSSWNAVAVDY